MALGVNQGHGQLELIARQVLSTDTMEVTREELDRSCLNAGLNLGEKARFLSLFSEITDQSRDEPLSDEKRSEFLSLVKQAKMEHKVRYVGHQMMCMPPTYYWEFRTFVNDAVSEVKVAVEEIKERLVKNGATKVIVGRLEHSSDAGIYAEFDENVEPQDPWERMVWGGPFLLRKPDEVVGFRFVGCETDLVSQHTVV